MVLKLERYVDLLRNQINRNNNQLEAALIKSRAWKVLNKKQKQLNAESKRISNQMDALKKKQGIQNWDARNAVISTFREEWDKVDIIVDKVRKAKAREKLLRKYKLWG